MNFRDFCYKPTSGASLMPTFQIQSNHGSRSLVLQQIDLAVQPGQGQLNLQEILLQNIPVTLELELVQMISGCSSLIDLGQGQIQTNLKPLEKATLMANFRIKCSALENGQSEVCNVVIQIKGNEDPLSKWEVKEPDPGLPFAKPHRDAFMYKHENWTVLGASARGRGHALDGTYRDDDIGFVTHRGWHVMAVADGAGSSQFSRRASQVLMEAIRHGFKNFDLEELDQLDWANPSSEQAYTVLQPLLKSAMEHLRDEVALADLNPDLDRHKSKAISEKDFYSTLLLVMHRPMGNQHQVLSFWVGDGAICLLTANSVELLGQPDTGMNAGETEFFRSSAFASLEGCTRRCQMRQIEQLEHILLMTDGVSDPAFNSLAEMKNVQAWRDLLDGNPSKNELQKTRLWQGLLSIPQQNDPPAALQEWLDFWYRGEFDDRSIIWAWSGPPRSTKDESCQY